MLYLPFLKHINKYIHNVSCHSNYTLDVNSPCHTFVGVFIKGINTYATAAKNLIKKIGNKDVKSV